MICQKCKKREATTKWVGEGGVVDFIHGMYQEWCGICCLEAQIAYAEKHKNDLKKLKEKLKKLKSGS